MKNYVSRIVAIVCGTILFAACEKKVSSISYADNGTPPVLSASSDSIALVPADSSSTALALTWTNPNYTFSNGVSSLNVNYNVQIDTAGSNFGNASNVIQTVASDLSASFTVAKLNSFLGNSLSLKNGVPHSINVRVASYLNQSSLLLYSNVLTFMVTPYAPPPKVTPPTEGTLFIVGSATTGGWDNPLSVNPKTQQFTQISPTEYSITIPLTGGGEYKTIAVNGSWSEQWSVATADTYPNGGPFVLNGANNIAPATSGTYKIDFNFQTGLFSVTLQ